jgi:hypothetical protein
MTHQNDCTLPPDLMEGLVTDGIDGLPEIFQALINTAMQGERTKYIQAEGCQRSEAKKKSTPTSRDSYILGRPTHG